MPVSKSIIDQLEEEERLTRCVKASLTLSSSSASSRKRRYDAMPQSETSAFWNSKPEAEAPDMRDPWIERKVDPEMSLQAYRATTSHNLRTPVLGGIKGLEQFTSKTDSFVREQSRVVAASRRAQTVANGITAVRVDAASQFNFMSNYAPSAALTQSLENNLGIDASANLNLLHALGQPTKPEYIGKSPMEVNEMLQSLDVSVAFPYDLGKPHVSQLQTQRFLRRLSESDKYLLNHVAPLHVVRDVPDVYQVTKMWFHDVYAPKLAYWADRQQGTWTRSQASFPSQMRGLRTEMELHTLLKPEGPLQWFMQHEQMYTGVERTLCMLVKHQLINYAIRRFLAPWQPSAAPRADDFVRETRKIMSYAGGCQKFDVGITKLINYLRARFDAKDTTGVVFGGVREMVTCENNNPIHMFSFITGAHQPKIGQDDRVRSSSFWTDLPIFYLDDSLTPDGAEVLNTIKTLTRWNEYAIIAGYSDDPTTVTPGTIQLLNESTDLMMKINFYDAFIGAFGANDADYVYDEEHVRQFPFYLKAFNIDSKTIGGTLRKMDARKGNDSHAILDKMVTDLAAEEHTGVLAPRGNTLDQDELKAAAADLGVELEGKEGSEDFNKAKALRVLFSKAITWPKFVEHCCRHGIPLPIDLKLDWTMRAQTAMLLGLVPGRQTIETVVGNVNNCIAFNGVTKSITDNMDFRCAIPVRNPHNIDSVPAAYVYNIEKANESKNGQDFVTNADIESMTWNNKHFLVIPLFANIEPKLRAEAPLPVVATSGSYPGVVEDQNSAGGHYAAGRVLARMLSLQLQSDRYQGALDNYPEAPYERPGLEYRAVYGILHWDKKTRSPTVYKWIHGEGLRGDYVYDGCKQDWASSKILHKPKYLMEMTGDASRGVSVTFAT